MVCESACDVHVRCFAAMPVSVPEEGERIYYMVRPSLRLLLWPALF